jgi:preprotein translocase subunit SecB
MCDQLTEKKTMAPLFRLERYFFTRTLCNATPGYKKGENQQGQIQVRASIMNNNEDPSRWKVSLTLGFSKDVDRTKIPYDIALSVEGFFVCPATGDGTDEQKKKLAPMIYVQGASLLYAMATEYLRNITAAGPYGPFILPSYSFAPADLKVGQKKGHGVYVKPTSNDKGLVN